MFLFIVFEEITLWIENFVFSTFCRLIWVLLWIQMNTRLTISIQKKLNNKSNMTKRMTNFHKVFNYIITYSLSQCCLIFKLYKKFILLADYTMTDNDFCAQIIIKSFLATDILVKIDDIFCQSRSIVMSSRPG